MKKLLLVLAAITLLGACAETIEWSDDFCKHCKEEFAAPPGQSVSPR